MKQLISQRYLLRRNIVAIVGFSLAMYFCYHVVAGERSYLRLMSLERRIVATASDLSAEHEARVALEAKVAMLRPGSLSRDLLEERARAVLGYAYEDERIVLETR